RPDRRTGRSRHHDRRIGRAVRARQGRRRDARTSADRRVRRATGRHVPGLGRHLGTDPRARPRNDRALSGRCCRRGWGVIGRRRQKRAATAMGLALWFVLGGLLGDPTCYHPVAGFGRYARAVESRMYRDDRAAGALYVGAVVAPVVGAAVIAHRATRTPLSQALLTAATTWTVLGGRSLVREGEIIAGHLQAGDLAAARARVTHLVGRDPHRLDERGVSRAVVESLAENTSDAVVAPLLWGAVLGVPGLVGYRSINTLDAMVGYRSARYRRFGWASARADDIANLVPSRVAAALAALLAPLVGGRGTEAWHAWRRDGRRHPSPNAGVVE